MGTLAADLTVDVLGRQARMRAAEPANCARLPAAITAGLFGLHADAVARFELLQRAIDERTVSDLFRARSANPSGRSGSRPETTPFPDPVPTPVRAGALTRNPETRPS